MAINFWNSLNWTNEESDPIGHTNLEKWKHQMRAKSNGGITKQNETRNVEQENWLWLNRVQLVKILISHVSFSTTAYTLIRSNAFRIFKLDDTYFLCPRYNRFYRKSSWNKQYIYILCAIYYLRRICRIETYIYLFFQYIIWKGYTVLKYITHTHTHQTHNSLMVEVRRTFDKRNLYSS